MALHSGARFYLEKAILAELLEDERWQRLADHPTQFDKDLEHLLKRIREYMRLRYGIEAHRPTQNESRDAKIYVLHREHSLSFTQIGQKIGISRGAAQRAYERYEERQSRAIQCLKELGECTRKWSIPLYVAAREASQRRQPSESSDPPPRAT